MRSYADAIGLVAIFDAENSLTTRMGEEKEADRRLPIHNLDDLATKWDQFVRSPGRTYSRVVFACHGAPGCVGFNVQDADNVTHDLLNWGNVPTIFGGRDYRHVFPTYMRVYFVGCNCAETDLGWLLLESIAKNLCSFQGGLVYGWTSKGYGDHARHYTGDIRYVDAGPGGDVKDMFTASDVASVPGWLASVSEDPLAQRRRDLMEDNL